MMHDEWPVLRQQHGDALEAAFRDITACLEERADRRRPALVVQAQLERGSAVVTVAVSGPRGARAVHLGGRTVLRAMRRGLGPLRLIAAAQASRMDLGADWYPDDPEGDPVLDADSTIEALLPRHQLTSADDRIDNALRQRHDVLLVGRHGSGKSSTVAARARSFLDAGGGVVWLDLTSPAVGPQTVYHRLLDAERRDQYLVVVDGSQANIPVLKDIFAAAVDLRDRYGVPLVILATGLTTLVERLPEVFRDFRHVLARPDEIIESIIDGLSLGPDNKQRFRELASSDLMIAGMIVAFFTDHHHIPTRRDLEEMHTHGVDDLILREALYRFACLGYFQIDVPGPVAHQRFASAVLTALLDRSLLVNNNGQYSAGPRSRAALVLRHALRSWDAEKLWGHPADEAWRYLQVGGESAMRATLDRLDLIGAGASSSSAVDTSTRYLLAVWDKVNALERRLVEMCSEDPTWQNNSGAAIFAALSIAHMTRPDREDAWNAVAAYIRGTWIYDDLRGLPRAVPGPTTEHEDFPKIRAAMAVEDRTLGRPAAGVESAETVDVDRFHRSWMLGMLLCFEGAAIQEGHERARQLQEIAERQQDPDGFFYPRRVPWVTARVILGLCSTGLNYETSPTVRRACDWLLTPASEGGAHNDSWWRSGTGSWNRQEATTAMCLAALLRADAPRVGLQPRAMAWLWTEDHQNEWRQEGREIDLALVIEAMPVDRERQRDAYPLVPILLNWALRELDKPMPEDVNEGGLRLPFVTFELITFIRQSVISEFSGLLADLLQLSPLDEAESDSAVLTLEEEVRDQWIEAIRVLRDRIQAELRNRDQRRATYGPDHPEVPELRQRAAELRADQAIAAGFDRDIRKAPTRNLLRAINEMGKRICGMEWLEP